MTERPTPPVPIEADMRGLAFMPLDVGRLLDSDLFALSTGEEFKAAVALWCKCWTQIPAGSLPDEDRVLAHLSGAGARWRKLKPMALRGFILCSDGRLYHPLIAEKVNDAWAMRLRQRERSARGNAKRWNGPDKDDNHHGDDPNNPTGDPRGDATSDPQRDAPRDRKGQGQYKGQVEHNSGSTNSEHLPVQDERASAPNEKPKRNRYPAEFVRLWDGYPTGPNMSKKEAFDVWKRLPQDERDAAFQALPGFRSYCSQHPDYPVVHLCRFLSKRRAEGFLASAEKIAAGASVFVKKDTAAWMAWQEHYRETKGKGVPVNKDGGWYFPTEWPPKQHEDA